jgi:hypothetical protein
MKMSEDDLLRYLNAEQQAAYQHHSTNLSPERSRSMREYMREPYGTEEEGRSSVVSSDVFDAIEGMLPDLVEVFTATDKAVVFDPVGPEDEEGAKQATDACNYVFYKQNNGFLTLYTAAKDGLMLKTGGIKWWWDVRRTPKFTKHRGVDEMTLALYLTTHPKAVVVEQEPQEPTPEEQQQAQMMGQPLPQRFVVKLKEIEEKGSVKVCAVPPDELQVSRRHNSLLLDDCPYVCHLTEKTLSDIRQMGYKVEVEDVKAAQNEDDLNERDVRLQGGKWGWWNEDEQSIDDSMVRGWLREEYVLVDYDGDGIAERRKVVRLGQKVLENVEVSHVPIAAWTPYILQHRFEGLSVADLVSDFQRIGTEIWRQQLDNLQLANNQETIVLTDSQGNPQADIDDLLNRRPGGIMRERVAGAIRPYQERWQGIEAMPMVEMLRNAKEQRTGYSPVIPGLDANALNKTATEVAKTGNERQKRAKLMARIMAEALVAPTMRGIMKTLSDYCLEKLSFRLRGSFVQVDPQDWRDSYDTTINVGIGIGDRVEQQMALGMMAQAQMMAMQSPYGPQLVSAENVYNLNSRLAENAGFRNPGEFWTDPKTVPPQPPGPNPEMLKMQQQMQLEQMKLQADAQKFQAESQLRIQEIQAQNEAKMAEVRANLELQAANDMRDGEREANNAAMQVQLQQAEQANKRYIAEMQAELDKYKAELDAQVKLAIANKGETPTVDLPGMAKVMADAMNAPAIIVRDENGRAIGIQRGMTQ